MRLSHIDISGKKVGPGYPAFIIAEMSCNHLQDFERAKRIISESKNAGADAVKLQTFSAESHTLDIDKPPFLISSNLPWKGQSLYNLYKKAEMPWEWQPKLKKYADEIGIILFSAPSNLESVDFLEEMDIPVYKITSFESIDHNLIKYCASKGKPLIISTGCSTLVEIAEFVEVADECPSGFALLKCVSQYPAPYEDMNLLTIPHLEETFHVPVGLSDHTLGTAIATASVALGGCIIEKHLTLSRSDGGPDASFSIEPHELKSLVDDVRAVEKARGKVSYKITEKEQNSRCFRRSLFVVQDMKKGDLFTRDNFKSIRPGNGLTPRYYNQILGRKCTCDIERGTPLTLDMVMGKGCENGR